MVEAEENDHEIGAEHSHVLGAEAEVAPSSGSSPELVDHGVDDDDLEDGDDTAIDVDFTEELRSPAHFDDDDEDPPLAAEYVPPPSTDPLEQFFANLPNEGEAVTIVVHRKQDPKNSNFRIPCTSPRIHVCNMLWTSDDGGPDEFHEAIARQEGGGYYDFQPRGRARFGGGRPWVKLIADPAQLSERERTGLAAKGGEQQRNAEERPPSQTTPAAPVDAFTEMKKRLTEAKEIQQLLAPATPAVAPGMTMSADEQIKLKIYETALHGRPELTDKMLDYAFNLFPSEKEKEKATNIWDVIETAFRDPQGTIQMLGGVMQIGSGLLGNFFGGAGGPAGRTSVAVTQGAAPPKTAVPASMFVPPEKPAEAPVVAAEPSNASDGQHSPGMGVPDPLPEVEW